MKKNLVIAALSIILIVVMIALNHVTNRVDTAIRYINELEECYPDYIDTVSGGDAYSEWYNY